MTEFAFAPGDLVTITFVGLNYHGRVVSCTLRHRGRLTYSVEYAAEGAIKNGDFEEDELKAAA